MNEPTTCEQVQPELGSPRTGDCGLHPSDRIIAVWLAVTERLPEDLDLNGMGCLAEVARPTERSLIPESVLVPLQAPMWRWPGCGTGGLPLNYAPRILIVDDADELRAFFVRTLLVDGYCVTAVATARQAIAAIRDGEFELVVLDFSLPDGDGLELTRQLRCEMPSLHILAVSGYMLGDMPAEALAAGANSTLPKPTTSAALRRCVSELLACADLGNERFRSAGA